MKPEEEWESRWSLSLNWYERYDFNQRIKEISSLNLTLKGTFRFIDPKTWRNYLFILALCPFRWHRIAYSVQGKFVTLFLDCQRVQTMDLPRGDNAEISTEGVTVFGTRLLDTAVFEVGLCQRAGVLSLSASVHFIYAAADSNIVIFCCSGWQGPGKIVN